MVPRVEATGAEVSGIEARMRVAVEASSLHSGQ